MTTKEERVKEAQKILTDLGMPKGQTNERSALTLLALLNLPHGSAWSKASSSLIGITPIMDWVRDNYDKSYKPNTRESVRRRTIHQFMQAAIVVQNPDMAPRDEALGERFFFIRELYHKPLGVAPEVDATF